MIRSRTSRAAGGITALVYLALYLPLVTVAVYSFHSPAGFTLEWYGRVLANEAVLRTLAQSLWVGAAATVISVLIGTPAALAIRRTRFRGRRFVEVLTYLPLVMPEIVLGLAMLLWFVFLGLSLGTISLVVAHVTFCVSYVIVTVGARLHGFDAAIEEAAYDLGASSWEVFWKVTLPLIWPGILSGALMAFTLSFDDFLISFFVSGPGAETLPLQIYSMIKFGISPELHALSTLMVAVTLVSVGMVFGPAIPRAARTMTGRLNK